MSTFHDAETYRVILEGLQTGVYAVDLDNRIQLWNDGAERITGYLRHEVIGRSCVENVQQHCTHTKCGLCVECCPLSSAVHSARPVEVRGFLHHKGGHRIPVHMWAVPIRDTRGFLLGAAQSFDLRRGAITGNRNRWKSTHEPDECLGIASLAQMTANLIETLETFADTHSPFGLLCVRLNDIDELRAKCGHEAASLMLNIVGETLEGTLRPTDFAGRWNDDQLLAILPGCSESDVISVCNRIHKVLATTSIEWWGTEVFVGRISMGQTSLQVGDKSESVSERLAQSQAAWNADAQASAAVAGSASDGSKNS